MGELRENKKRETRQRISDIATRLFFERGFEAVTVEEIAAAANVSKVTVFNYFTRKEELLLDREDDLKLGFLREALARRPKGQSPVPVLKHLLASLREEKNPFTRFEPRKLDWWSVVEASPSLKARLREIWDEATDELAAAISPEGLSRIVAGIIVLSFRTAHSEALAVYGNGGTAKKATTTFFSLLEHGFNAVYALY